MLLFKKQSLRALTKQSKSKCKQNLNGFASLFSQRSVINLLKCHKAKGVRNLMFSSRRKLNFRITFFSHGQINACGC